MPVAHDSLAPERDDLLDSTSPGSPKNTLPAPHDPHDLDAPGSTAGARKPPSALEAPVGSVGSVGPVGPVAGAWRATGRALDAADRFVRLHFLGFTSMLVLLGAGSVRPEADWLPLAGLLAIAFCFHVFAYVFNDVVDLPVDRSCPSRQDDFLVRGTLAPWQALAISLGQIPLAAAIHLSFGWPPRALWVLLGGFAFMAIYDLWGKVCPLPPATDLAQGLGWGSLVLYAAFTLGEGPNALTWTAFVLGCGYIFLINGVHGGLRDLANDLRQGRRTTAIFFGSRPRGRGPRARASVEPGLVLFATTVHLALVVVSFLPLATNAFGYEPAVRLGVGLALLAVQIYNTWLMTRVFYTGSGQWQRDFRLHLGVLLVPPMILFLPSLGTTAAVVTLAGFALPKLFFPIARQILGELFGGRVARDGGRVASAGPGTGSRARTHPVPGRDPRPEPITGLVPDRTTSHSPLVGPVSSAVGSLAPRVEAGHSGSHPAFPG